MKTFTDTERLNALIKNQWIVEPVKDHWDGNQFVSGFSCESAPCGWAEGGGNCPMLGFGKTEREAIDAALSK